jgi:hypothetical protein
MASSTSYAEASMVGAEEGQVLVDGPGSVAVAMTPEAAEETGRRLIEAAALARRQRAQDEEERR